MGPALRVSFTCLQSPEAVMRWLLQQSGDLCLHTPLPHTGERQSQQG